MQNILNVHTIVYVSSSDTESCFFVSLFMFVDKIQISVFTHNSYMALPEFPIWIYQSTRDNAKLVLQSILFYILIKKSYIHFYSIRCLLQKEVFNVFWRNHHKNELGVRPQKKKWFLILYTYSILCKFFNYYYTRYIDCVDKYKLKYNCKYRN